MAKLLRSEKAMAPHSSTLAWKIPWTEEPGGLQSMGSLRVGHDWATSLSLSTFMHWRRKWQPTPVFLPGESQGRGSLVGCRLWGRTESDTTEATATAAASYLSSGHPVRLGGICSCLHSLRGVTTLLIHLLCLTKSSPSFCCISRRVSESIRCLPMDHLPEPASFYRKPSFCLSLWTSH